MSDAVRITGGCQCGAVRYALHATPRSASVCYCRMCQKAFGSFYAPLAGVPNKFFEVTRGRIATFQSSDEAERGFCADCGTPLTFRYLKGTGTSVSIGSLDHPEAMKPIAANGIEGRIPWMGEIEHLPGERTEDDPDTAFIVNIRTTNRQHPDHDTAVWPPA